MTELVAALPPVTEAQHARILGAPRDAATHAALMADIPAMNTVEIGGTPTSKALPREVTVAAWNLERCLFPEASAAYLAPAKPALVLVSEMDIGMDRTGQRNTIAEMAAALGMTYAFGVEFYEVDLGSVTERLFCKDGYNALGFHGNGILSSVPIQRAAMFRLDPKGHWFCTDDDGAGDPAKLRLGGRMAVAAVVMSQAGPICAVSTHLEANCGPAMRHAQFETLLDAVDEFAPDMPVLIGGDLNSGNHLLPRFDWRDETLFDMAEGRGYDWSASPDGITVRASLISPHESRRMRLDWFATRGLTGTPHPLRAPLRPDGIPLSDHKCILADFSLGHL
ncbi:endonuclease/exonuclease/phosphatase family protein [Gymnodinialimonas sp. 2305UL16-5]|uniref:endonuclease/exonuclease/phosphatase family protein n=1 Tax=Gymnodinialimonas mytili TaxID=3126503 RepID=UPI0030A76B60